MIKVGMVWYELNIVNQLMNLQGRYRAVRAAKNIEEKSRNIIEEKADGIDTMAWGGAGANNGKNIPLFRPHNSA